MTLWNIIRDFFVQYIFGGVDSIGNGYYDNYLGALYDRVLNEETYAFNTGNGYFFKISDINYLADTDNALYIAMGDWLSTTATIITLCAICFFLFLFVRWLFRLTAGLISCRG